MIVTLRGKVISPVSHLNCIEFKEVYFIHFRPVNEPISDERVSNNTAEEESAADADEEVAGYSQVQLHLDKAPCQSSVECISILQYAILFYLIHSCNCPTLEYQPIIVSIFIKKELCSPPKISSIFP